MALPSSAASTDESTPPERSEQHSAVAYLGSQALDGRLAEVAHSPVALCAADLKQEVLYHLLAVPGMVDLGVELHAVEASLDVGYRHGWGRRRCGRQGRIPSAGRTYNRRGSSSLCSARAGP